MYSIEHYFFNFNLFKITQICTKYNQVHTISDYEDKVHECVGSMSSDDCLLNEMSLAKIELTEIELSACAYLSGLLEMKCDISEFLISKEDMIIHDTCFLDFVSRGGSLINPLSNSSK